eukprot:superscaffoldBa00000273_g3390
MMVGEVEVKERPRPSPDYLMQLLNEKKLMTSLPNLCGIFTHLERLLDEVTHHNVLILCVSEINRVRKDMYSDTVNGLVDRHPLELPDAMGPIVHLQEKLFVPVKEYPDAPCSLSSAIVINIFMSTENTFDCQRERERTYNFVGRILGPRGLTAKQLEAETGCKIMVRGKSSMRDKKKEEQNRGKPNWEHLNEDLHVLITVEDTQARAEIKMRRAVEEVKKLLVPAPTPDRRNFVWFWPKGSFPATPPLCISICTSLLISNSMALLRCGQAEGEDNLKKMQLMELAILNGTYRDNNIKTPAAAAAQGPRLIAAPTGQVLPPPALRPPTPAGAPIMNLIRPTQMAAMLPNGTPTLVPPTPDGGLIYTTPYEYPYALAPTSLLEYPIEHSGVLGKRAWGSMGAAGTAANFSQPGHEGSLFYPGAGVLDAASMSHSQDLLKGAMATKVRRHDTRVHPYQRIVTADRAATGN